MIVAGHSAINAWRKEGVEEMCVRGKPPDMALCIADEHKGTVGSQVLNNSSPGVLRVKGRCELNVKDWINS